MKDGESDNGFGSSIISSSESAGKIKQFKRHLILCAWDIGSSEVNNKDKLIVKNQTTLYKTGDLVHCEDGLYFFKGRTDFQVKIRGYRIELEDLEATLMRELTGDFCVMASNELQLGNYESAAVLFSGGSSLDDVRHVVERSFPKYIPISNVKKVSKVPRNINGKLDRKAVKGMMSE